MGIEDIVQAKIQENPELVASLGGINGSNFKRVVEFCKASIEPIKEIGKIGKIKFDYTYEEFAGNVLVLCQEFYFGSDSKYLKQIFKEKSSPNENILRFLNEVVLEPTTTSTCVEITKDRYKIIKSEKFKNIGEHFLEKEGNPIDALRLICYLIKNYNKTLPKDSNSCVFASVEKLFRNQRYGVMFSDSIWRNLYHDVNTCKFNGDYEMRAAMLDCADEHIHYLLITPKITEGFKKTQNAPAQIVAILVDAEEVDKKGNKTGNKYLVIEGVFGVPWFKPESVKSIEDYTKDDKKDEKIPDRIIEEIFSEEEVKLRDFLYELVYDYVLVMAAKTKRGLFVNSCFSSHYPPQGPIHFVNYFFGREYKSEKGQNEKGQEGYNLVLTTKEDKMRVFRYKQNLPPKEKDYSDIHLIKEESPEVDRLFTVFRRLNTWHDWTRYIRDSKRSKKA
ncbi:hypothetical protein J4434_01105 [Candidatus Woesearchaeota archaeon]|nr:hypothetical protein [Candidatus Woesearchaeota archaeon]